MFTKFVNKFQIIIHLFSFAFKLFLAFQGRILREVKTMKLKQMLISALSFCICLFMFITFSFFYLDKNAEKDAKTAQKNVSGVPYYSPPDDMTLFLSLSNGRGYLIDFLFSRECVNIKESDSGGHTNYFIFADDYFIADIIDISGGINITKDGKETRYTGIMAESLCDNKADRIMIIKKIIDNFSKNGFSKDAFRYIIENTETNLSAVEFTIYEKHIKSVCRNCFIESR